DNRIDFAAGRNPADLKHRGKPLFSARGRDVRFNPRTETFERITGGQQFGLSMDDWGNRFVCSNSNHIQQVVYPQHYLARNPYLAVSGLIRSIAADGASARVFRISPPEPWRIIRQKWRAAAKGYKLVVGKDGAWKFIPLDPKKTPGGVPTEYPVGYFTSATGISIYRGNAYPKEYRGNAFIGDVGGNLVHRKRLTPNGVLFAAARADSGEEFVRSSDNWFRPVNFVNAPDGTLYILDMYRETIEHPHSIPEEIKRFLHLTSGNKRGRIYRLVSPRTKRIRPLKLGKMSAKQLVAQLESDNAWNRMTAQRLLWERREKSAVPLLANLTSTSTKPLARMHALYTLAGLAALKKRHVITALKDRHPRVREHAVRLSERFLKQSPHMLLDVMLPLCNDPDARVRFQVAFSLGEATGETAIAALARLAKDPRNGREVRTALLSSVGKTADRLAAKLISDPAFVKQKHAASLLSELGLIVAANRDPAGALRLLANVTAGGHSLSVQRVVLASLGAGLGRRGSSLSRLLADKRVSKELRDQVAGLFAGAARTADDSKQPLDRRAAAIGLLAFADFETVAKHLPNLLSPQSPQALQQAAVAALRQQESDKSAKLLLSGWRSYSPKIRADVVDALLSSRGRIAALLSAVEFRTIRRGDLSRDKKQQLLAHPDRRIRARAAKLFAGEVDANRAKVVAAYRKALSLEGNAVRGENLFRKTCSVCHRVGNFGSRVAPDLASVKNKSAADLLVALLDPNREAQPNFNVYTVLTKRGRIYTGIIVAETANSITLRRAEAKQDVVLRSNIDRMVSSGKSLMPEGLEKDLSLQDFADVIAFVKSIKPPGKGKP
ncbi:MAG: PVC-type heme-binding CxxCH protein, partial [Planctomycetaceae bacterium]